MTRVLVVLVLVSLLLVSPPLTVADDSKVVENADLTAADQLYKSGKFADAADKYQSALETDPKLIAAQAGLIRSFLRQQKVDDAYAAATSDLTANPASAALLTVMGEVQFRRAEMPEAEMSYLKALTIDPKQVHAYLGLAYLYRTYSMYRQAYDQLQRARKIAPDDVEVQRAWFGELSRKERLAAIEAYLAGSHPDDPLETESLQQYLKFLQATVDKPVHACKLVNKVEQTDAKLEAMLRDPRHAIGYGLVVKINDRNERLLLDTGASGILIGRKAAEKAGLTRISERSIAGIGDKGLQSGYFAVADHIRVGELEFADCVVHVTDRASITEEDGLIGANVFGSYLVNIDMSAQKLRLSQLPKRPDEAVTPTDLNTEGESGVTVAEKDEGAEVPKAEAPGKTPKTVGAAPGAHLPRDRYVAPEMAKWTPIFRFGHALLIPTHVNDSRSMLFMIDTGSNVNVISQRAAKQVTKTTIDPYSQVKGLSGNVSDVYRASKATLVFGHLAQKNLDMVTVDLSNVSRHLGTELSGMLGFEMLHMLQVKIDYRDGLVDFVYDANRWGTGH